MRKFLIIMALVLSLALAACSSETPSGTSDSSSSTASSSSASSGSTSSSESEEPAEEDIEVTLGEVNGNLYVNESLKISMEIPDSWYSLDEDQLMAFIQASAELVAGGDAAKQSELDLSLQSTLLLVSAYEFDPTSSAEGMNSNLQLSAEKLSLMASVFVRSADDYIAALVSQLEQVTNLEGMDVNYAIGETEDMTINGKNFRVLPVQLELGDGTVAVLQNYYVYFDKAYAYVGIGTYFTDEQKAVIESSLNTLKIG